MFLFYSEVYVLMSRGHIFAKWVSRFRWFKKYKNINIPSIKTWFELYRTFIQPVFLMMWKENVSQYWTYRGPHSNTIYLNIKNLLNVKNDSLIVKFSKSQKSLLDIPLTKVSGFLKSFFSQISVVSSNGMLVNIAWISKLAMQKLS